MTVAAARDRDDEAGVARPLVTVIVVSYGSPADTIACLDSIGRQEQVRLRIVVCDNGPAPADAPGSAATAIRTWASARYGPGAWCCLPDAEVGSTDAEPAARPRPDVVLILSGRNRGFAGGVNLALSYCRERGGSDYYWLLNNDAVAAPGALAALLRHAEADERIGLCGSTLLHRDRPDRIQARGGGWYDPWLGRTRLAGAGELHGARDDVRRPELDFVHGASMLVRGAFVETVGPMDERYFLYFEELDWAARAKGRFLLAHAADSLVWHADGGASADPARRSAVADYHGLRSRLLFTRRFHPALLPVVRVGLLAALGNRLRRRQWDRVGMVLRLMLARV